MYESALCMCVCVAHPSRFVRAMCEEPLTRPYSPAAVSTSCLTLLHSERPKLSTILAFLSAIGLNVQSRSHGCNENYKIGRLNDYGYGPKDGTVWLKNALIYVYCLLARLEELLYYPPRRCWRRWQH